MAKDTSFNYQDIIIEGFICPSCLKSFSKPDLLEVHFANEHFNTSSSYGQPKNDVIGPALGRVRVRTADFDKLRKAQVDRNALETNLLLIRLEKLSNISDNLDTAQRHAQEQKVVPWIEAKVNLCPRCGVPFGLGLEKGAIPEDQVAPITSQSQLFGSPSPSFSRRAREGLRSITRFAAALIDNDPVYRRVHHCRLCGHIICGDCSFFLSKDNVLRIIQACNWTSSETLRTKILPSGVFINGESFFKHGLSFSSRSSSGNSLDSIVPKRKNQQDAPKLRICEVCKNVLEDKMLQIEESNATPVGFEEFQALKLEMAKVSEKMPLFSSMANSLNSGEEKYVLEIAKSLRLELLQSLQKIDEIGKSIAALQVSGVRSAATQARLNQTVGKFARRFVQNNLAPLRVLPSETEHRRLAQSRLQRLRPSTDATPTQASSTVHSPAQAVSATGIMKHLGACKDRCLLEEAGQNDIATQNRLRYMASFTFCAFVPKSFFTTAEASRNSGWVPAARRGVEEETSEFVDADPRAVLMRQVDLVADYLAQAQAAHRSPEEVNNLAQNLADLEAELGRLSASPNP
ncbi:hypothetical protein Aperf_G00000088896 [Anoplocephala perfoliata]